MPSLPFVRNSTTQVLYPFTLRVRFQTITSIAANGKEQRAASRGVPLFEGSLTYSDLNATDYAAVNTFFNARGGQFDQTWDFHLGSALIANCKLTQDSLRWTETNPRFYSTSLGFRQVNNAGYGMPAMPVSFPNLSSGVITQYPYGPEQRQLTTFNDQASGYAYATKWYGAGLSGFPTAALRRWTLSNPILPDADATLIRDTFIGCRGMYHSFLLTDPDDGTLHQNVRFASDILEIQYQDYHRTAINLVLEETNG